MTLALGFVNDAFKLPEFRFGKLGVGRLQERGHGGPRGTAKKSLHHAPQGVIETPADTVLGLAYTPNNQQLVSAGSDGLTRLWQLPVADPRLIDAKGPVKVVDAPGDACEFTLTYCSAHKEHRAVLTTLADLSNVDSFVSADDKPIGRPTIRPDL